MNRSYVLDMYRIFKTSREYQNYLDLLPKNITESTVIHLRLGDVIAGNEWHEKLKRPLEVNHIKSLV